MQFMQTVIGSKWCKTQSVKLFTNEENSKVTALHLLISGKTVGKAVELGTTGDGAMLVLVIGDKCFVWSVVKEERAKEECVGSCWVVDLLWDIEVEKFIKVLLLEVFIDEMNCVEETLLWWIEKIDDACFTVEAEKLGQYDEIMTMVGQLFPSVFGFDGCNWVVEYLITLMLFELLILVARSDENLFLSVFSDIPGLRLVIDTELANVSNDGCSVISDLDGNILDVSIDNNGIESFFIACKDDDCICTGKIADVAFTLLSSLEDIILVNDLVDKGSCFIVVVTELKSLCKGTVSFPTNTVTDVAKLEFSTSLFFFPSSDSKINVFPSFNTSNSNSSKTIRLKRSFVS